MGIELRAALQLQIDLGHLVRNRGGENRVVRGELDPDHARIFDRVDFEPLTEFLHDAILRIERHRIRLQACHDKKIGQRGSRGRVEFLILRKVEFTRYTTDQIRRLQKLRLAGDVEAVEHGIVGGSSRLSARQIGRTGFDQKPCLSLIARRHHAGDGERGDRGKGCNGDDPTLARPHGGNHAAKIDIHVLVITAGTRHRILPVSIERMVKDHGNLVVNSLLFSEPLIFHPAFTGH